jgi:cytochrome P450
MAAQDDWYRGHFIPKGTWIFVNTYGIHHDEKEYDRPEKYIPERWLDNKFGTKNAVVADNDRTRKTTYAFSAGRLGCPGSEVGEMQLVS